MESSEPSATVAATAAEEGKTGGENKKMKVLVAVDESECSIYALSWTLDHLFNYVGDPAEGLHTLILLHVQQPVHGYLIPAGQVVPAPTSVLELAKKAQEQKSASVLSRALQVYKEKSSIDILVKVQTIIMDGEPKDMISRAAEQMQVDLLVVGSRGLGKIKRAFLGSVSDSVAHHASCPVLIVKPPKMNH